MAKSNLFAFSKLLENKGRNIFGKSGDDSSSMPAPQPFSFSSGEPTATMTVQTQAPVSEQPKATSWYETDPTVNAMVQSMLERTYG